MTLILFWLAVVQANYNKMSMSRLNIYMSMHDQIKNAGSLLF